MIDSLAIGPKTIGLEEPIFLTAEVGVTCNYDLGLAKELIDVVAEAGADAAKFIFWFPDEIMSDRTISYAYATTSGPKSENMYEMLSKLRFSLDQWFELKGHADHRGVTLFSTVNSPTGVEWGEAIGLEAYKLSSWDFNYHPLWRRIAALGKPMIIDTGPVRAVDVAKVIALMHDEGNEQAVLVHCFHTDEPGEMNMRTIPYLRSAFGALPGFSAKGRENDRDLLALALGATYLEKRLTMSRDLPGHHHAISLEPDEFKAWVETVRGASASLGEEALVPSAPDLSERKKWFRHLVASEAIPEGTVLTPEMIACKRPEGGVSPEHFEVFVGRKTRRKLEADEAIRWTDV